MDTVDIISHFGLTPHPEGGFYRQMYRSAGSIPAAALPPDFGGERAWSTAILFLLRTGDYSHLHRIRQDEVWHFYLGGPLRLVMISPQGKVSEVILGQDLAHDHYLQYVVPAGFWFGATPAPGAAFCLVGCTVAPGFDFADFELGERNSLERLFPSAKKLIGEFA